MKDDEYLLKLRVDSHRENKTQIPTGFMTKFNKNGSMPVAFKDWGMYRYNTPQEELPIYIHTETFSKGWKLSSWRFGMSQQWAAVN